MRKKKKAAVVFLSKVFFAGLIIAILILTTWCIFVSINPERINFLFFDDSFYYLNLEQSSLLNVSSDGISNTNGFHLLWLLLLMAVPINGLLGAQISASTSLLVAYIFLYKVFRCFSTEIQSVSLALFAIFFPASFLMSMSGMESSIVLATFALFLYSVLQYQKSGKVIFLAISSLLFFLARTDMVLFIIPVVVWLKLKDIRYYAIFATGVIAYLLYNYTTTGDFMQASAGGYPQIRWAEIANNYSPITGSSSSVLAKMFSVMYDTFKTFISYLLSWYTLLAIFPIFFYKQIKSIALPLLTSVLISIFVASCVRLQFQPWYLISYWVVFLVAISMIRFKFKWVLLIIMFMYVSYDYNNEPYLFKHWKTHDRPLEQLAIAQKLTDAGYTGKFGAYNSGEFRFYNDRVVNLDGLANNDILKAYECGQGAKYLRDNNIEILIDVSYYFMIFNNFIPLDDIKFVGEFALDKNRLPQAVCIVKHTPSEERFK